MPPSAVALSPPEAGAPPGGAAPAAARGPSRLSEAAAWATRLPATGAGLFADGPLPLPVVAVPGLRRRLPGRRHRPGGAAVRGRAEGVAVGGTPAACVLAQDRAVGDDAPGVLLGSPARRAARRLRPWRRVAGPAVVGFVACVLTVVAAGRLGHDPDEGDVTGWFGLLARPRPSAGWRAVLSPTVALTVIVLSACWWQLARRAAEGRVPERLARLLCLLWALPFAVGPPLFSRDVYAYAAQGELARRGLDPARVAVRALGPGPLLSSVDPRWRDSHSPYGSSAVVVQRTAAALAHDAPTATVVWLRVLAVVAVVALVALSPVLAERAARAAGVCDDRELAVRRASALVFVGLNPVVLLHLVAGAHLDAVMGALLVGACVLERGGRHRSAVLVACLAGTIKVTGFLGVLVLALERARRRSEPRARLRGLAGDGLLALVPVALSTLAAGHGLSWVGALGTPGRLQTEIAPASLLASVVAVPVHLLGLPLAHAAVLATLRLLALVLAAAVVLALLLTAPPPRDLRVVGGGIVAVSVLSPVVYPWYLAPSLPTLGVLGGRPRRVVQVLSVVLTLSALPTLGPTAHWLGSPLHALGSAGALLVLGATGLASARRVGGPGRPWPRRAGPRETPGTIPVAPR